MTENLIIFNTRVVTPLGFSARCGKEMEQLSIIDNATVWCPVMGFHTRSANARRRATPSRSSSASPA